MVKSHFSFISCADIVQVFQSMFPNGMIAKKWHLENRRNVLWNMVLFDGISQKKDRYVLIFDESLNQQLKKTAGHPSYIRIKLNLNRKLKTVIVQWATSILMVVQVTLA